MQKPSLRTTKKKQTKKKASFLSRKEKKAIEKAKKKA